MSKETLRKVGRILETGGFSLVFERGEEPPVRTERREPSTRLQRFAEILSTGGYSLLDRHVEIEQTQTELIVEIESKNPTE